jgi:uncharacterized protein
LILCTQIVIRERCLRLPSGAIDFEWDDAKAASNLAKHGVSFPVAARIFDNIYLERVDDREDYGELRIIGLGRVELEVYRVVYTWRNEHSVRIISAQKATQNERKIYYRSAFS